MANVLNKNPLVIDNDAGGVLINDPVWITGIVHVNTSVGTGIGVVKDADGHTIFSSSNPFGTVNEYTAFSPKRAIRVHGINVTTLTTGKMYIYMRS